ncbi:Protein SufA [Candidatus Hartigia pinicola]|nr:Protein SufA [Candidatus Hartigia pinicola]
MTKKISDSLKISFLDQNTWQGANLTDNAAKQIKKLMKQYPNTQGLALSIKQSGCAGFSYIFDMIENPTENYLFFEHNGAHLYIQKESMPFIDGTVIDYVQEGLNRMFKFNNPKAQHACGCGESFSV